MTVCELLSDKSKWTWGAHALDAEGNEVPVLSSRACCWCLIGALMHCYSGYAYNDALARLRKVILRRFNIYGIHRFNDTTDFATLRSVIEEAGV